MTLEEIKAQHPELYKQIRDEGREEGVKAGVMQENKRIKAIEEMALTGHEALVAKAKYETGMTAEQLAVEMIKAEKAKKTTIAQNREMMPRTLTALVRQRLLLMPRRRQPPMTRNAKNS